MISEFRIGVVGCGKVGMTAAYALMLSGTATEIVLYDRNKDKAMGEKLDLEHSMSLLNSHVRIRATDVLEELADVNLIVYTAGVSQQPNQTRLDLVKTNKKILEELLPTLNMVAPESVIMVVANPVDVLVQQASKMLPNTKGRLFGTGTLLDTARFRFHLSEILKVSPHSIHAYILGEHGDSSFPVFANTTVGGQRLLDIPGISDELVRDCYKQARDAAYKIIEAKGATYYAIGVVVSRLAQAIFSDSKTVYPLSVPLIDYQGFSGVALSVPCVLGAGGIERILDVDLDENEKQAMARSVATLKPFCE